MPDAIAAAFDAADLHKRLAQLPEELRRGDGCMNMPLRGGRR